MDPTKSLKSIARVFHLLKPHIRRDEVEMQQFVLTPVPFADEYSLFITDYVGSPRLREATIYLPHVGACLFKQKRLKAGDSVLFVRDANILRLVDTRRARKLYYFFFLLGHPLFSVYPCKE
ncbi:uncharacterized protein LOC118482143 isoform X2 [Helianthus annuus]|uniref:uncharacterized protein LOC118482143 isoform X2 n=1 Tax=Helianthus annuus TaxID=4232 RepID=UPI0016532DC8|nr:uncharacterized protein LOC118482143 isoform X2 [Helianthus annuus]